MFDMMDERLRDLSVMYEIVSTIGTTLDLTTELNNFLTKITSRFGYDIGAIILKDETHNAFVMEAATGFFGAERLIGNHFSLYEYGIGEVISQQKPIIKNELYAEDRRLIIAEELREKINSLAFLPIPFEDNPIGILRLFSFKKDVFQKKSLLMIQSLTKRLGTAIHHIKTIDELQKTKDLLTEEKETMLVTLLSIGDGVIVTDCEGKVVMTNKVAERLNGWTNAEAVGRPLSEIFHIVNEITNEPCENPVEKMIERGHVVGLADNTILISKDMTKRIIEDSAAPIRDARGNIIGVVFVFRDITEKRLLENEMLKAKKIESLGTFAGGIAHDFNNLLTGIIGNISLVMNKLDSEHPLYRWLEQAETTAWQAHHLANQLLTFSKGGEPIKGLISLGKLIREASDFVLHGSNVYCEYDVPDNLWLVEADSVQLQQVIQNLVINALQAMPMGGVIKIRCENFVKEKEDTFPVPEGKYVKISVKDNGIGIPKGHLLKIFDPYFTTKQKGGGLGLTIAYSIIKKHGGNITVDSVLGEGTTFFIYLPAFLKEPSLTTHKIEEHQISAPSCGESILVMDDEDHIVKFVSDALTEIGYTVEGAKDGMVAVYKYKEAMEAGKRFKAVILDLTVPGGMGGKEAVKEILTIDPTAKAIVSTGYYDDPIVANFRRYGFSGALVKPYDIIKLRKAVHETINLS